MLLSNIEEIPGKSIIEHYGVVSGSTVRAKNVGRDFAASLKNIVGGELKGYTQLLSESRAQAVERMKEQAGRARSKRHCKCALQHLLHHPGRIGTVCLRNRRKGGGITWMYADLIQLLLPWLLILLAMVTGTLLERAHFKRIHQREREFARASHAQHQAAPGDRVIAESSLVMGDVVISIDYFKRFLASLRNIFGGEVKSYGSLIDRGRREAILRMKEQMPAMPT